MKNIILAILYWLWSLTWNGINSLLGFFVTLYAIIFKKGEIHKNGYGLITEFGGNWGGLSLGCFQFCGKYSDHPVFAYYYDEVRSHEFGHSLQGLIWGPLGIFAINIPSMIRYHYYMNRVKKGYSFPEGWYNSAWFEGQATRWGTKAIDNIEGGKK